MITAKIICDSLNPQGNRLTTYVLTYPRFILAEFNTHRMLSRNSASSRAIPISKMISEILKNPAYPVSWGQNQKGMQARTQLSKHNQWLAEKVWVASCYCSCGFAWLLNKIGVHKQLANRIIEPWAHAVTIASGTEWDNFFALRTEEGAQPEFRDLALKMQSLYHENKPKSTGWGEWHLPFSDKYVLENLGLENLLKITVARCARVSYLNFEGDLDFKKDYALHDRLLKEGHFSPFEHAAQAGETKVGNFKGWLQYRHHGSYNNKEVGHERKFNP